MSPGGMRLTLDAERCNQCGACVEVCPLGAVRVGGSYVLVDWHACNHCGACAAVCEPGALRREVVPTRTRGAATGSAAVAPGNAGKVVVGSRAEAKAVRKAAEQAAKQTARTALRPAGATRTGSTVAQAPTAPAQAPIAVLRPASVAAPRAAREAGASGATSADRLAPATIWTWVDACVVLAVLLATIVGKNAVLGIPALKLMPAAGLATARVAVLTVYYAVQLGALFFLAGRHGTSFSAAFGLGAGDGDGAEPQEERASVLGSLGLALLLLVGVEVVALGYGMLAPALGFKQPWSLSTDVASVFGGGGVGLAISAVLVGLVAPIAEELAFRGVLLTAVGERLGMWPAIAISSVLFAAYHLSLWMLFPMLALGAALGWLAWTRRSLWPAIALHVLYNGLAVAAAFWFK